MGDSTEDDPEPGEGDGEGSADEPGYRTPLDPQVLVHAAALGSVGGTRLPGIVAAVQAYLDDHRDEYRRQYECVHEDGERAVFLVPEAEWDDIAVEASVNDRAIDAVKRAHEHQLRRLGGTLDRREEFETALEIRSAVVIGA